AEAATACERTGQHEIAVRARVNLAFATAFAGDFDTALQLLDTAGAARVQDRAWAGYDGGAEPSPGGSGCFHRLCLASGEEALRLPRAGHPDSSAVGLVRVPLALVAAARGAPSAVEKAEAGLDHMPETDEHVDPWGTYRAIARA